MNNEIHSQNPRYVDSYEDVLLGGPPSIELLVKDMRGNSFPWSIGLGDTFSQCLYDNHKIYRTAVWRIVGLPHLNHDYKISPKKHEPEITIELISGEAVDPWGDVRPWEVGSLTRMYGYAVGAMLAGVWQQAEPPAP